MLVCRRAPMGYHKPEEPVRNLNLVFRCNAALKIEVLEV